VNKFFAEVIKAPIVKANAIVMEEQRVFGLNYSTFPTDRRSTYYRLALDASTIIEDCYKWFQESKITIGDNLTAT